MLFLSIYLNCLQAGVLADSIHSFFGKAQFLHDDPCRLSRAYRNLCDFRCFFSQLVENASTKSISANW